MLELRPRQCEGERERERERANKPAEGGKEGVLQGTLPQAAEPRP